MPLAMPAEVTTRPSTTYRTSRHDLHRRVAAGELVLQVVVGGARGARRAGRPRPSANGAGAHAGHACRRRRGARAAGRSGRLPRPRAAAPSADPPARHDDQVVAVRARASRRRPAAAAPWWLATSASLADIAQPVVRAEVGRGGEHLRRPGEVQQVHPGGTSEDDGAHDPVRMPATSWRPRRRPFGEASLQGGSRGARQDLVDAERAGRRPSPVRSGMRRGRVERRTSPGSRGRWRAGRWSRSTARCGCRTTTTSLTPCVGQILAEVGRGERVVAGLGSTGSPSRGSSPSISRTWPRAGSKTSPVPGSVCRTQTTGRRRRGRRSTRRLTRSAMSGCRHGRSSRSRCAERLLDVDDEKRAWSWHPCWRPRTRAATARFPAAVRHDPAGRCRPGREDGAVSDPCPCGLPAPYDGAAGRFHRGEAAAADGRAADALALQRVRGRRRGLPARHLVPANPAGTGRARPRGPLDAARGAGRHRRRRCSTPPAPSGSAPTTAAGWSRRTAPSAARAAAGSTWVRRDRRCPIRSRHRRRRPAVASPHDHRCEDRPGRDRRRRHGRARWRSTGCSGLDIPAEADGEPHVDVGLPGGLRLAFDTEATIASFHPAWKPGSGAAGWAWRSRCPTPRRSTPPTRSSSGPGTTASWRRSTRSGGCATRRSTTRTARASTCSRAPAGDHRLSRTGADAVPGPGTPRRAPGPRGTGGAGRRSRRGPRPRRARRRRRSSASARRKRSTRRSVGRPVAEGGEAAPVQGAGGPAERVGGVGGRGARGTAAPRPRADPGSGAPPGSRAASAVRTAAGLPGRRSPRRRGARAPGAARPAARGRRAGRAAGMSSRAGSTPGWNRRPVAATPGRARVRVRRGVRAGDEQLRAGPDEVHAAVGEHVDHLGRGRRRRGPHALGEPAPARRHGLLAVTQDATVAPPPSATAARNERTRPSGTVRRTERRVRSAGPRSPARAGAGQDWRRTASISRATWTFSLTTTPPPSSGMEMSTPKSLRLIVVVAEKPARVPP